MTDRAQFEAMLNALINEDQDAAKEIFHNIVVAKSREIYEELLAEDFDQETVEAAEEEEEAVEEGLPGEEEQAVEGFGEEEASDEEGDAGEDDFGGEEEGEGEEGGDHHADVGGEEELEDRVMDLEDALEDLKAEFEQLMAGEENEPEHADMFGGDEGGDIGGDFGGEEEVDEFAGLMEYTVKVPNPTHGDNGQNTKSIVAGKNDMGGTTANIAKSFSTTTGGTQGGLLKPTTELQDGGNINVPGAKAGKSAFTKKEPGHGAEKAGAKETADNKQSVLKSLKK